MSFQVRLTLEAAADLERLFDFVVQCELMRHKGDLDLAERALEAIRHGISTLRLSPFTCHKVGTSPFLRELIIAFGRSGYVALFEIVDHHNVVVSVIRHQLEDDYH